MGERLDTPAWLLIGLRRSVPGNLHVGRGRLWFKAADLTVFDAPLTAVRQVSFPWYYFGGGVQFTIEARRYRLSFVRPNTEGGSVLDISAGRRIGKAWKQVFAQLP